MKGECRRNEAGLKRIWIAAYSYVFTKSGDQERGKSVSCGTRMARWQECGFKWSGSKSTRMSRSAYESLLMRRVSCGILADTHPKMWLERACNLHHCQRLIYIRHTAICEIWKAIWDADANADIDMIAYATQTMCVCIVCVRQLVNIIICVLVV